MRTGARPAPKRNPFARLRFAFIARQQCYRQRDARVRYLSHKLLIGKAIQACTSPENRPIRLPGTHRPATTVIPSGYKGSEVSQVLVSASRRMLVWRQIAQILNDMHPIILRTAASISVAVWLAGCASSAADPTPEAQARTNARDEMVCETVRPTGSRLPKRVCRKRSDIERDGQVVDDFFGVAGDRVKKDEVRRPGFGGGKWN